MKRYKQKPKAEAIKNLLQVYSFIGDTARHEQEQGGKKVTKTV